MRDNLTENTVVLALAQATISTATNGISLDLRGCNALSFTVFVDNSADTLNGSNYWTVSFEEADDNGSGSPGTWGAVPAAKVVMPVGVTDMKMILKNTSYEYGLNSIKRWARIVFTPTGTHSSGSGIMAVAVKSHLQTEGLGW